MVFSRLKLDLFGSFVNYETPMVAAVLYHVERSVGVTKGIERSDLATRIIVSSGTGGWRQCTVDDCQGVTMRGFLYQMSSGEEWRESASVGWRLCGAAERQDWFTPHGEHTGSAL
jgi:hypothetical protein